MRVIRIQEVASEGDAFAASVTFDGGSTYSVRVTNPFTPEQENNLEWYFEQHLRRPFVDKVRAREAGKSVHAYGAALFDQLFADRNAFAAWTNLRLDLPSVRIEIAGSHEFQSLHWECLVDSQTRLPIATQAVVVRRHTAPQLMTTRLPESTTVNILLISARSRGARDISYRTISRPLVNALEDAHVRARIEIVRPGTYEAFLRHLDENRSKPEQDRYHVVHFDLHGALLTYDSLKADLGDGRIYYQAGYGREDIASYDGKRGFLMFAGDEEGKAELVEADQLARHLIQYGVPIAVLNACQSGKQVGAQETSLASRLMDAGLQLVVAMGYSVTVTAAEIAMITLYRLLLDGKPVASAIAGARHELERQKSRRADYGQKVDLEDWILPVVYESQEIQLTPKRMFPEEEEAFFQKKAARYEDVSPEFGFFGRDLDILNIENRLLVSPDNNILLVRGMGGAGKSTLLQHLAAWWQRTGLIEDVFYFGYDEKAHTRQQILWDIAKKLFDKYKFTTFESSSPDVQQTMVASELRKTRHLLILDNLESITGERLAIPNTLKPSEQKELQSFLHAIRGGQSLVLLGSRSDETWLASGTFGMNVYELGGLDPEAASNLANRILEARGASKFKADKDLVRLIKLLAGFPLALEVVLSNLPAKSPTVILEELEAGGIDLDKGDANDKTQSIVACIAYSHSNLSEAAQSLLLCLAPFSGVFTSAFLKAFTDALKAQLLLVDLDFDRWPDVLAEAQNMGLMTANPAGSPILRLQPVFPYFLRTRLKDPWNHDRCESIESAFRDYYRSVAGVLIEWMKSNEPDTRQLGLMLTGLEGENLRKAALDSASAGEDIFGSLNALSHFFEVSQDHEARLAIARAVRERLDARIANELQITAIHLSDVLDELVRCLLNLNKFEEAKDACQEKLVLETNHSDDPNMSRNRSITLHMLGRIAQEQHLWPEAESYYKDALKSNIEFNERQRQAVALHQLGRVAEEQRQWFEAESYYKEALAINVEFNDRYTQAPTLHHLGIVAQEQSQWPEAERYYKEALAINVEFNDRYRQANTLHQLGTMVQEQRKWSEAEGYYKQALTIKVEFNDLYGQASTFHQLGVVAEQQRHWAESESYYQQALTIFVDFKDEYNLQIVVKSLALLWQASGNESVIAATSSVLGIDQEEVRATFRRLLDGQRSEEE